ncbi:MAG: DUF2497 domain-containing protein [Proteobacteria bacterium]|nr:DUF2497 domain-containing protein [Pseudomonadota bacterium]
MADQKGQQEPSMEEILASIRKIISEDDEAEKDNASAPSTAPLESAESVPRADDDVLELTEMVDSPSDPKPVVTPDAVNPELEEREAVSAEREVSGESEQSEDDDDEASVESVMAAVRRLDVANDPGVQDDDVDAAVDLVDNGAAERTDEPTPFAIETQPAGDDDGDDDRDIITDRAASAASQALAELAGALGDNRPRPDSGAALPLGGSNRTVEDLVREMLRPMLREWLDANLPDLVQRLVRKEIKEMVRRAEDR